MGSNEKGMIYTVYLMGHNCYILQNCICFYFSV